MASLAWACGAAEDPTGATDPLSANNGGTLTVATGGPPAGGANTGGTSPVATGGTPAGGANNAGGTGGTNDPDPVDPDAGAGGDTGQPVAGGSEADYEDPGVGAWPQGTPDECGMDTSKLADGSVGNYAVFRYGKLCHMKGSDSSGQNYSATKTLGSTMVGRAAYVAKDVAKSGPGTGPIQLEDLGTDWIATPSYPRRDATIAHIMSMVAAASPSLDDSALTWRYDTVGSEAINNDIQAVEKCIAQVQGMPRTAREFVQKELFDKLGMSRSSWGGTSVATGWTGTLTDMGRLGTLLLHDGWYNGERLLARNWVYRMSHPNFESANTSYGLQTWLNHRGNAAGIGGNITSGSNAPQGDPCAPAAFWPEYPHVPSAAPDCMPEVGTCDQQHDVGIFSAQGLGGQFVVMHPALDLVIAAHNFSGGDGPMGLWRAVRPAIVAVDPVYKGDEAAFCEAYGNGNYAPDLVMARHPSF